MSSPPSGGKLSTTSTISTFNSSGSFSYTNTQRQLYFPGDSLNINWTLSGKVTPVKNQGSCSGSGWAFAAVSDLESTFLMKGYAGPLDLSEQQLIDCSGTLGNYGCNGGWAANAMAYMTKSALTTESLYPYLGSSKKCGAKLGSFAIKSAKAYNKNDNCDVLVDLLRARPITVGVAADPLFWKYYKKGVLDRCPGPVNHNVALTGVKNSPLESYWIIKNSWGTQWGIDGYMKIDRSQLNGNMCQICSYPSYTILN